MKKLFSLCIVSLFSIFSTDFCLANGPELNDDLIIDIKPTKPIGGVRPRTITDSDIEATYFMEAITFVFNTDLGNCIIDVININTGDTWSASCDGIGSTSIYTSGDEGNYMIYIDTENGAYTGEFVL